MQVTAKDAQLTSQLEEFRQYKIRAQTVLRHKAPKEDATAADTQRQVLYMYVYICVCVCMYMNVYVGKEDAAAADTQRQVLYICNVCVYVCI